MPYAAASRGRLLEAPRTDVLALESLYLVGISPGRCRLCTALWRQSNLDNPTGKLSDVRVSFTIGGL
jgi:hypothetical protein